MQKHQSGEAVPLGEGVFQGYIVDGLYLCSYFCVCFDILGPERSW